MSKSAVNSAAKPNPLSFLTNPEAIMGVTIIGMILALIVPLPTTLLDFLLAISLASSVVILLVSVYIEKPLDFGVFPSVLLISTIFRLGLNVATTRNILQHGGEAGGAKVSGLIQAFGHLVVGESFIIGVVIFIILMIINFMVVSKGAGRIAELNSGHIQADEARRRRKLVERESEFYGAMDGASKFVRGEAIASIIITLVNVVVGFIVGVVQHNLTAAQAAATFSILSVGDGLVSAFPSLFISFAAGMIVTRSGGEGKLGGDVFKQFKTHPKAFFIPAFLILAMGLLPGVPKIPFFGLSIGLFVLGRLSQSALDKAKNDKLTKVDADEKKKTDSEDSNLDSLMKVDILSVEVGHGLVQLIDPAQDGEVVQRIQAIRKQFAQELGVIVPQIQLRDNLHLEPGQYQILLKGNAVTQGSLMVDYFMAMDPGSVDNPIRGEQTQDPVYGLSALWVHKRDRDEAMFRGYTVVNCATVIATHITKMVRQYSADLLTRQDVQYLVDRLKETNPKVVEEVLHQDRLTLGDVVKVMQNLLREDVSVRDFLSLFECLADHCRLTKNPDILSEQCRRSFGRGIVGKYMNEQKELLVVTFDRTIEDKLSGGLKRTELGSTYLDLDPKVANEVLQKLMTNVSAFETEGTPPCLLVSAAIRSAFQRVISPFLPEMGVLAYDEVPGNVKVKNLKLIN
jgi:flagellar biosynthesis protein FlhA